MGEPVKRSPKERREILKALGLVPAEDKDGQKT